MYIPTSWLLLLPLTSAFLDWSFGMCVFFFSLLAECVRRTEVTKLTFVYLCTDAVRTSWKTQAMPHYKSRWTGDDMNNGESYKTKTHIENSRCRPRSMTCPPPGTLRGVRWQIVRQNVVFLNVAADGAYSHHWALNGVLKWHPPMSPSNPEIKM